MQSENVFTSFRLFDHPADLIIMMTKAIRKGALIATFVAALVFTILFYEFVPLYVLFVWLLAQFALSIVRVNWAKKLEELTIKGDEEQQEYLYYNIVGSGMSGLLWGVSSWLAVIYAPEAYTYYVFVILLALTAGATTTLGSIFQAYIAFVGTILLMLSGAFFYYGTDVHMVIAIINLIGITILTATGSDYYLKLRKIVELSVQLKSFNTALEERVQKEVKKNMEKDIQLMHQARLAQMGEMVSMIAHQWRQPLHIISTAATDMDLKIQFGTLDDATSQKNITTINRLTQHLSATIDDFRDFFKVTKEMEITTVDEVVNVTLKIVKEYVENKKIVITTDLNSSEKFKSYPNELKQVLINLLKNAEDALLEKQVKKASIHIVSYSDKDRLYFEVHDNAGGIADDVMENIFNAYFTTKEDGGTGLGLYMSKKIIEEHCNGELHVQNTEEGACFTVSLPR